MTRRTACGRSGVPRRNSEPGRGMSGVVAHAGFREPPLEGNQRPRREQGGRHGAETTADAKANFPLIFLYPRSVKLLDGLPLLLIERSAMDNNTSLPSMWFKRSYSLIKYFPISTIHFII